MPDSSSSRLPGGFKRPHDRSWTASLIGSYVFDWFILILVAIAGGVLAIVEPNKRPFSLLDPNISFPYTEKETVPVPLLLVIAILVPFIIILVVCLIFVPGGTVPKGTPRTLLWKRKLWELHVGWLGLALTIVAAWFTTNGMKNMFGRPRPDLLSRCDPDLANFNDHVVGGIALEDLPDGVNQVLTIGMLVSASICRQTDSSKLDDGFRSYPSGHSSNAAAGFIYLSLFLASKFAVTIPFVAPFAAGAGARGQSRALSAFPSRLGGSAATADDDDSSNPIHNHNKLLTSVRRQAAAPPVYLLVIVLIPFFTSIFVSGSRWFDFRHHAFDIMFGYFIGIISAFFGFYYYHLPIRSGAGWAWGPRSHDKAWWSGVGSHSYATDRKDFVPRESDEEEALYSSSVATAGGQVNARNKEQQQQQQQSYRPGSNGNSYDNDNDTAFAVQGVNGRDYSSPRGEASTTEVAGQYDAQQMTSQKQSTSPAAAAATIPAGYSQEFNHGGIQDPYFSRSTSPGNQGLSYNPTHHNRI